MGSVRQLPRVTMERTQEMGILVLLLQQTHCLSAADEGAQRRAKLRDNMQ